MGTEDITDGIKIPDMGANDAEITINPTVKFVQQSLLFKVADNAIIKENGETKSKQSSNIINTLAGMDVNKISDGLNGMKKILNILSEVAKPEEQPVLTRRKISKPYQSSDD